MQLEISACQLCSIADPSAKHMMCQLTDLIEWNIKEKKEARLNPLYTVSLSLSFPSFLPWYYNHVLKQGYKSK